MIQKLRVGMKIRRFENYGIWSLEGDTHINSTEAVTISKVLPYTGIDTLVSCIFKCKEHGGEFNFYIYNWELISSPKIDISKFDEEL